ncbi:TRAP transporter small permease [Bacillus sp. 1P02SD]|uniref:TRAP transporter small permease n=1 Tax=Bacillus sp. 1P02SD TaxID=3132264 RepID=UPI0039A1883B
MRIFVKLEEWILVLLMSILCLLTFGNVLARYIFHSSFSFTEELTTNLFPFIIFIGAALLAREKGHLGFALLNDILPKRFSIVLIIIVGCLTSIFFIALVWYGIDMVIQQYEFNQKTPAMGMPAWIMGLAIPFGSFLCIYRFWEGYIRSIHDLSDVEETK